MRKDTEEGWTEEIREDVPEEVTPKLSSEEYLRDTVVSKNEWERRIFQTLRIACAFSQEAVREREGGRGNMTGITALSMT